MKFEFCGLLCVCLCVVVGEQNVDCWLLIVFNQSVWASPTKMNETACLNDSHKYTHIRTTCSLTNTQSHRHTACHSSLVTGCCAATKLLRHLSLRLSL